MNNRLPILLLPCLLVLLCFTGCIPPKDLFSNWEGEWRAYDASGFLDFGCNIFTEDNRKYLTFWEYAGGEKPNEKTRELTYFHLYDQYSRNYGSEFPTWLYIYRP